MAANIAEFSRKIRMGHIREGNRRSRVLNRTGAPLTALKNVGLALGVATQPDGYKGWKAP